MKNSLRKYSHLLKPIIYKILSKLFLGFTFSLAWNKFINKNQIYALVGNPFFFVAAVLLAMGWFNYLKLDGISIGMGKKSGTKPEGTMHQSRKLIDIIDEDVVNYELEKEDEILSAIIANVLTGVLFLIISIIFMYL
nr:hypothetical protein [Tissierella sp.]